MEKDYLILRDPTLDHGDSFEELKKRLQDGWERAEVPYNPYGTEVMRIMELVKYTDEEKAEKAAMRAGPMQPVDVNCLTVPIISYADEQAGKENPYKILAAKGYTEVHRTSSVAVMKFADPRGVLLSNDDLEIIVNNLSTYNPFDGTSTSLGQFRKQVELHSRLSMILKTGLEAKAAAPTTQ